MDPVNRPVDLLSAIKRCDPKLLRSGDCCGRKAFIAYEGDNKWNVLVLTLIQRIKRWLGFKEFAPTRPDCLVKNLKESDIQTIFNSHEPALEAATYRIIRLQKKWHTTQHPIQQATTHQPKETVHTTPTLTKESGPLHMITPLQETAHTPSNIAPTLTKESALTHMITPPHILWYKNSCYIDSALQALIICKHVQNAIDESFHLRHKTRKTLEELHKFYKANSQDDQRLLAHIETLKKDSRYDIKMLAWMNEHLSYERLNFSEFIDRKLKQLIVIEKLKNFADAWRKIESPKTLTSLVDNLRTYLFKEFLEKETAKNQYEFNDPDFVVQKIFESLEFIIPRILTNKEYKAVTSDPKDPFVSQSFPSRTECFKPTYDESTPIKVKLESEALRIPGINELTMLTQNGKKVETEVIGSQKIKLQNNKPPPLFPVFFNYFQDYSEFSRKVMKEDLEFTWKKELFSPATETDVRYVAKSIMENRGNHWVTYVRNDQGTWFECNGLNDNTHEASPIGRYGVYFFYEQEL